MFPSFCDTFCPLVNFSIFSKIVKTEIFKVYPPKKLVNEKLFTKALYGVQTRIFMHNSVVMMSLMYP